MQLQHFTYSKSVAIDSNQANGNAQNAQLEPFFVLKMKKWKKKKTTANIFRFISSLHLSIGAQVIRILKAHEIFMELKLWSD